jgi:glyoxylase-like metal-dependent hydrolase (beta-lactamase superfamily II)
VSDMSAESTQFRAPTVNTSAISQVADGIWVIPDSDFIPMVPNIGIVVGSRATLVIDTGLGTENAQNVLDEARRLSAGRPLFLTLTHFHPEHGYGANVFAEQATIVYNEAQWVELEDKGEAFSQLFREGSPDVVPLLEGVEFTAPHVRYTGSLRFDLGGGQIVEMHEHGGGHSRGDQIVLVRGSSAVLFTGDLVEDGYFGVIPDDDSHVMPWIARLEELERYDAPIVVPGHGLTGGPQLTKDYREYFQLAKRRMTELRAEGGHSEEEMVDQVHGELLDLHPDWENKEWARVAASNGRRGPELGS